MCRKYSVVLVIITFMLSIGSVFAQTDEGDVTPCPGDPEDPGYDPNACHLPLDTWVFVLVVAAIIYGAYRMYKKQKALTI
jgi:hypothetical protein